MDDPSATYVVADPMTVPPVAIEELVSCPAPGFWLQERAASRDFLRRRPLFHDDPDGAGVCKDLSAGMVAYPPVGILALADVTLVGFRTFLTTDGRCFSDEMFSRDEQRQRWIDKIASPEPFANEKTRLSPVGGGAFARDRAGRREIVIDEPVIVISSDEPDNYGSFLFRVLPKLIPWLRASGHKVLVPVPSVAVTELLALVGIAPERIVTHDVEAVYRLRRALVPTLRNPQAFLDDASLGLFAGLRRPKSAGDGRRLYVSRQGLASTRAGYRQLINAPEVAAALDGLGFTVVQPEAMSVAEQVAAFSAASIVVGQSGAGLFNAVFCHPGTFLVDIESEPHWIHAHMCLFSSLSLRYCIFEGLPRFSAGRTIHVPLTVDVPALVRRVRHLLQESP